MTYLNPSRSHLELIRQPFPKTSIRLGVVLVDVFENLELRPSRPFPVLDLIRLVSAIARHVSTRERRHFMIRKYKRVERPHVDLSRVDARWDERRYTGR